MALPKSSIFPSILFFVTEKTVPFGITWPTKSPVELKTKPFLTTAPKILPSSVSIILPSEIIPFLTPSLS